MVTSGVGVLGVSGVESTKGVEIGGDKGAVGEPCLAGCGKTQLVNKTRHARTMLIRTTREPWPVPIHPPELMIVEIISLTCVSINQ